MSTLSNPVTGTWRHGRRASRGRNDLLCCGSLKRTLSVWLRSVFAGLVLASSPHVAIAGGGPETTLIVVNGDSPLSTRIANAYAALRDIPQTHLIWLHDVPSLGTIDAETFRDRIWRPVSDFIATQGMEDQIDTIAYSADFPYAVDVRSDIKANKLPKNRHRGHIASLTGLTFFARRVEIGDAGYLNLHANQYFRRNLAPRPNSIPLTEDQQKFARKATRALKEKNYETAAKLYRELTNTGNAYTWYELARSLSALGRTEESLAALVKSVDAGWANSMLARSDEHLKSLHVLPKFAELLKRMEAGNGPFEPAHGFRSRYFWDRWTLPNPSNAATSLNRYYLSTLLAYTGVRGNSVPEVLRYLDSAAASDGAHPDGTVYLLENGNIRSEARQRFFPATVRMLEERNRRAEILTRGKDGQNGIIPVGKNDVIGAVVGARAFNWQKSASTLLPGAIAEALTSYGGHFNRGSQTKLSEFLRHGAAGSSGAVAEPFSFQGKFPVAMLHGYYAEGCSLAEAFYQSISGPYQLIIVGDPLARPFAYFSEVELTEPGLSTPWRGVVTIRPRVLPAAQRPIDRVELWVDGVQVADAPMGQGIDWDTRSVEDGSHEIRLVAVEAGRIETRSYAKYRVSVANTENKILIQNTDAEVRFGDRIELSGEAPNAQRVDAMRGTRILASSPVIDGAWNLSLSSEMIGLGRVPIFIRAKFPDTSAVRSRPIAVHVVEPPQRKAGRVDENASEGLKGVLITRDGLKRNVVLGALDGNLRVLAEDKKDRVEHLQLEGDVHVAESGFYQFVISSRGRFRIKIDDHDFGERSVETTKDEVFLSISLKAGWHSLFIDFFPIGEPYLKMVLAGEQVAEVLAGKILRHRSSVNVELDQGVESIESQPIPEQMLCDNNGPLHARLDTLKAKRPPMLDKYTEKHPNIVELDRQIRILQDEIDNLATSDPSCNVAGSKGKH